VSQMYLIIGQGTAGTAAANTLRRLDRGAAITLITAERDSFYNRIDLPDVIEAKITPAAAELQSAAAFAAQRIDCRMGERVEALLPDRKQVRLASGECLSYDKLLLATGSLPILPALAGTDADGVATLWTLADARRIIAASARRIIVVGAGLIGLKTALALAARGAAVTVVEKLPRVMPRQLDDAASGRLAERLVGKGIELLLGCEVSGIRTQCGAVTGVAVGDRVLAADMLVLAIGVRPDLALAAEAGLTVRRGIVVDAHQRTSAPDIYAAGDVAESADHLTGLAVVPATWPVATAQGRVAAANMAGRPEQFDGSVAMNSVDVAGLALASVGEIEGQNGDEVLVTQTAAAYRKLVLRRSRLRGFICLGDIGPAGVLAGLLWRQAEIHVPARLSSPAFSFGDLMSGRGRLQAHHP
jgi:nitrite reductase (NADH) large subunit